MRSFRRSNKQLITTASSASFHFRLSYYTCIMHKTFWIRWASRSDSRNTHVWFIPNLEALSNDLYARPTTKDFVGFLVTRVLAFELAGAAFFCFVSSCAARACSRREVKAGRTPTRTALATLAESGFREASPVILAPSRSSLAPETRPPPNTLGRRVAKCQLLLPSIWVTENATPSWHPLVHACAVRDAFEPLPISNC